MKTHSILLILALLSGGYLSGADNATASSSKILKFHLGFTEKLKITEVKTYRVVISSEEDLSNELIYFSFMSKESLIGLVKKSKNLSGLRIEELRLYGNIADFTVQPNWGNNVVKKFHKGISDSWQLLENDNGQIAMLRLINFGSKNGLNSYYGFIELSSFPTNGTYPKKVIDKRVGKARGE